MELKMKIFQINLFLEGKIKFIHKNVISIDVCS